MLKESKPPIVAICGAKAEIQGNMAIAQTEVPAKGRMCGACVYKRNVLSGQYDLISDDSNRHCWENRVPIADIKSRRRNSFMYSPEASQIVDFSTRITQNFVYLPLLGNDPVAGPIFGIAGFVEAISFARSRSKNTVK